MTERSGFKTLVRLAAAVTVGILLQTGGCAIDMNTLLSQWSASIAQTFLTGYAYDVFNATPPFSF
jgi:hypothetical protein